MKRDLARLTLTDQVLATMQVLAARARGGQKITHPSDLARYFKHAGFKTQPQRLGHFTALLQVAGRALAGGDLPKLVQELARHSVIFEAGDLCEWSGQPARVLDVLPDGKLCISIRDEGEVPVGAAKVVRAVDCRPRVPVVAADSNAN